MKVEIDLSSTEEFACPLCREVGTRSMVTIYTLSNHLYSHKSPRSYESMELGYIPKGKSEVLVGERYKKHIVSTNVKPWSEQFDSFMDRGYTLDRGCDSKTHRISGNVYSNRIHTPHCSPPCSDDSLTDSPNFGSPTYLDDSDKETTEFNELRDHDNYDGYCYSDEENIVNIVGNGVLVQPIDYSDNVFSISL